VGQPEQSAFLNAAQHQHRPLARVAVIVDIVEFHLAFDIVDYGPILGFDALSETVQLIFDVGHILGKFRGLGGRTTKAR
jgi:hypothetical protein